MENIEAHKLHFICRTFDPYTPIKYNKLVDDSDSNIENVTRPYVPDDKVSFDVEWPEYNPVEFTSSKVLANPPWADPVHHSGIKWNEVENNVDRRSFMGHYKLDKNGFPLNPIGRTGIKGRGLLGRWGVNHAADPIVTRWKRDEYNPNIICRNQYSGKQILQFVAICRLDTKEWAIPGGMRDVGEEYSNTLKREFLEEATNSLGVSSKERESVEEKLNFFFKTGVEIYSGYVDDRRNTDNSWMETIVYNFHDNENKMLNGLNLTAGDDAGHVKWVDIDEDLKLYANHLDFIKSTVLIHDAHWENYNY